MLPDNFKLKEFITTKLGLQEMLKHILEEKEEKIENLFEKIITEDFLNLMEETDIQVQEVQRSPNKMNPKRTTPRHIIIKMPKVKYKEKILKGAREKQLPTQKLSADFSTETLQVRRD